MLLFPVGGGRGGQDSDPAHDRGRALGGVEGVERVGVGLVFPVPEAPSARERELKMRARPGATDA